MTSHQWGTDADGDLVFGNVTDGLLRNTNGIKISPYGDMWIAHWNQSGDETNPMICCNAGEFGILE